ncbi:HEPN domain-containing protein [Actinoplanes sp. ATCC 53533]|uniref:HEPN domain-containing protein n=1 Tax=Actinoplanes sp. ATCC 53533 TaxID=1288362 RepID=UPI000F78217B|nr:HEPN domain-containing protein [Actinoplanes sp. ATCC 53533]
MNALIDHGSDDPQEPDESRDSDATQKVDVDFQVLVETLGRPFVEWVLVTPFEQPSSGQIEVVAALTRVFRQGRGEYPEHTAELVSLRLAFYVPEWNTTFVEGLRQRAGGQPLENETSGDELQDAIVDLASLSYGELLLPAGRFGPTLSSNLMSPVGARVVAAARAEGIFPGAGEDWGSESIVLGTALGFATGLQASFFGGSVVRAAWEAARLRSDAPTLPEFLREVREMLNQTRALLRGEEIQIPSLAGFTGIVLEAGAEVSGPWGRIRSARPGDHPYFAHGMTQRRTSTTSETGEIIEISDAGEVILETSVPYRVRIQSDSDLILEGTTSKTLDEMVERARIALALSWDGAQIPVVLPTWRRTISFMTGSIGYWSDPHFSALRLPTRVTQDQLNEWGRWLGSIGVDSLSRVRLAATRTLRALTERRNPDDMLIDAVIAWEALFGATSESTLRVSAALACLLYPPGQDRNDAQERYRKIYAMRSNIVHANSSKKTTATIVNDNAREAAQVAVRALRELLGSRSDLVPLKNDERSLRLLLEGAVVRDLEESPNSVPAS